MLQFSHSAKGARLQFCVLRPTAAELLNTPEGLEWRHVHYSVARLESTKRSSIILAAFCFAVFASLQVSIPTACPVWISLLLALNTAILILMHSFAFLVSVFMLPRLQAVVHEYSPPRDGDAAMKPCAFSPHDRFRGIVEISYNISHVLGLFLYLIEIVLLSWVKFWDFSYAACLASTVCMLPFLALFVAFCWYFNRVLSKHAYETRSDLLESVARDYAQPNCRTPLHEPQDHSQRPSSVSMSPEGSRTSSLTRQHGNRGHTNKGFVADIHAPDTE
ncbi:hypothetical protein B566_EDAN010434 [Ephemera danica]|nr:hypothetical protein B566_EDAN010434 [Ephemera danica]